MTKHKMINVKGLEQTLGEVLTISDAELDGLLDCGDEVIDRLSEFSSLTIIFIKTTDHHRERSPFC